MERHTRIFELADVLRAMTVAELHRRGVTLHGMRKLAIDRELAKASDLNYECFLASDRRRVWIYRDCESAMALAAREPHGLFLIPVAEYAARLDAYLPVLAQSRIVLRKEVQQDDPKRRAAIA